MAASQDTWRQGARANAGVSPRLRFPYQERTKALWLSRGGCRFIDKLRKRGLKSLPRYTDTLRALRRDDTGVTALEYGLIAALMVVASLAALTSLDNKLDAVFSGLASFFATAGR